MELKGINKETINKISNIKKEPKWMTDFRVNSYKKFEELENPLFGPKIDIDFDFHDKKEYIQLMVLLH